MADMLKDKVTVITGGTTGIGFATATRFIAEGEKVVLTGTNPKSLEAARSELNGRGQAESSKRVHFGELINKADALQCSKLQGIRVHCAFTTVRVTSRPGYFPVGTPS